MAKIKYWQNFNLAIVYGKGYDVILGEQRALLHVKFFVTEIENGDV